MYSWKQSWRSNLEKEIEQGVLKNKMRIKSSASNLECNCQAEVVHVCGPLVPEDIGISLIV